ncbi:MAG: prepilin-type N-terminal cleavage/methylation domain-containing protein [Pseudomonadota bacterium]
MINNDDTGFTLAEMLVALALLSLIFTALATALNFSIRTNEIAVKNDFQQSVAVANKFLRNTISRSRALYVQTQSGRERKLQFQGTKTSIRFVANLPGWTTVAGVHVIDIKLSAASLQNGRGQLIARFAAYRPEQTKEPKFYHPSTLLRNVQTVEFAYFGVKEQGQKPEWHMTWTSVNRLPQLVAISATFNEASNNNIWPDTVIRLFASQTLGT